MPDTLDALAGDTFFDQPWPSDLRLDSDGTLHAAGFPEPRPNEFLDTYLAVLPGMLRGASPVAAGFARFEAPVDAASLPADPVAATATTSSVQLIDIDPASPEHGQRHRISLELHNDAGVYWPSGTLAFMPLLGDPLLPATRYALVVTDALQATSGLAFRAADDLRAVLGLAPQNAATAAAATTLASAITGIESAGIARSHIVQLAVFTTSAPADDIERIRDDVLDNYPAPDVTPGTWAAKETLAGAYDVYEGTYGPSPDYQRGNIPFETVADGGELAFDANGNPEVQRSFDLRFSLAVPLASNCPMPSGGYPIVLYAHGTGGNYRSMLGSGHESEALAKRCIASMGIDQIFHGTRPGSGTSTSVELLVFNFGNPYSARAVGPESAIDVVQQARLFTQTMISVPAGVAKTGNAIAFDPGKVVFFGHSQGGLNGPIFMAIDDQARGGALSGSAGMLSITLLEKTQPFDIPTLVKQSVLGLDATESAEVTIFHPWVSLAQNIVDPTDTINYVPLIARHPRSGFSPKSVLMTEGVHADGTGDNYAPPHGIEVQAIALGLPPQEPVVHLPVELAFGGPQPVLVPVGWALGQPRVRSRLGRARPVGPRRRRGSLRHLQQPGGDGAGRRIRREPGGRPARTRAGAVAALATPPSPA